MGFNVNKIFDKLVQPKDLKERVLTDKVKQIATANLKKMMRGKLTTKDIDEYKKATDEYYKSYPDIEKQKHVNERIAKMRKII